MRLVLAVMALAVAACDSGKPAAPAADQPAAATVVPAPATNLPPPPRYVGRWAASADACMTGWWRFWNDELRTAGEIRCDILPPDGTSGDTRLRMVCQSDGKWANENWVIDYPGEGRMTVSRDGTASVALTKC